MPPNNPEDRDSAGDPDGAQVLDGRVRWARGIGDASWWVFVVGALFGFASLSGALGGMPARYGDYGWTAYTPLSDGLLTMSSPGLSDANAIAIVTLIAVNVTVIAAVAEGALSRNRRTGIAIVASAVVGSGVVVFAAYLGDPWNGGFALRPALLFPIVLVGIAVRELGIRWARANHPGSIAGPQPR